MEPTIKDPSPDVAIFISSMRGGGAERVMRDLANAFVSRGLRTDVLITKGGGPYLADLDKRVRLINFDTRKPIFALTPLVRYLKHAKPQALLSALDHSNLVAVTARLLSRVPIRHVVSQRSNPGRRPSLRHEPLEILNYLLLGPGYRRADAVVAVSQGVATELERVHSVPRDRVHVIYNGFAIPPPAAAVIPHPWLEPSEIPTLLAAGRLTYVKGFDVLIKAFSVVRQVQEARLIILGEGEQRTQLEKLARELGVEEHVLLPGFVPDPWAWMRHANLFVLSSRSEGLPGVLIQALACGLPVVSTDCQWGPNEILEGGRWGRLVPTDDVESLAQCLLEALSESNHPDGTERAKDFSTSDSVDAYLEVLGINESRLDSWAAER